MCCQTSKTCPKRECNRTSFLFLLGMGIVSNFRIDISVADPENPLGACAICNRRPPTSCNGNLGRFVCVCVCVRVRVCVAIIYLFYFIFFFSTQLVAGGSVGGGGRGVSGEPLDILQYTNEYCVSYFKIFRLVNCRMCSLKKEYHDGYLNFLNHYSFLMPALLCRKYTLRTLTNLGKGEMINNLTQLC